MATLLSSRFEYFFQLPFRDSVIYVKMTILLIDSNFQLPFRDSDMFPLYGVEITSIFQLPFRDS